MTIDEYGAVKYPKEEKYWAGSRRTRVMYSIHDENDSVPVGTQTLWYGFYRRYQYFVVMRVF
jgi:hypothetical protein